MNVIDRLSVLRKTEHTSTVQIVEALVICYRERAFLPLGYSSMWDYLTGELRYSPAAASRRYKAMKCALKFPQVIGMLRQQRVSLSSLAKAEALLEQTATAAELLDRIDGKPAAVVEKIVAAERPKQRKPRERVRRVAVRPDADPLFAQPEEPVEPRVSISTTLTEERYEAFERARAIVTRKKPGATVEDVLNELVGHYLKSKAPTVRNGKRPAAEKARTRHIPAATRDEVMLRDQEQCQFVGANGHRCGSRHDLQIDHVEPWASGGTHEPENLRVLCAAHNRHLARERFGPPPMRR